MNNTGTMHHRVVYPVLPLMALIAMSATNTAANLAVICLFFLMTRCHVFNVQLSLLTVSNALL